MSYYIYQLKFLSPVHFGEAHNGGGLEKSSFTFSSDSIFSAICSELAYQGEEILLDKFIKMAQNNELLFSDLFPYQIEDKQQTRFYLPRPEIDTSTNIPVDDIESAKIMLSWENIIKDTPYIRVKDMAKYCASLNHKKPFLGEDRLIMGRSEVLEKVNCRNEISVPYYLKVYSFNENTGLYGIINIDEKNTNITVDDVQKILELLGYSGIGGERSSGYGRFELLDDIFALDDVDYYEDIVALNAMLKRENAPCKMNISVVCPLESEIEYVKKGWYKLVKRSGFTENIKRKDIFMLASGSCFNVRLKGNIVDISDKKHEHPIYRYGKGMYVGLRL